MLFISYFIANFACVCLLYSGQVECQLGQDQTSTVVPLEHDGVSIANGSDRTNGGRGGPRLFDYWEVRWGIAISKWYLYFLVPIGVTGNSLAVITFALMPPLSTATLNIIILAVHDTIHLIAQFVYQIFVHNNIYMGESGCVALMLFIRLMAALSNWQITFISIERTYAVWKPFKVSETFTKKRAVLINIFIIIISVIHFIPMMIMTTYNHEGVGLKCTIKPKYLHWIYSYNIVLMVTEKIAPMVIVITCSGLIIDGVKKAASAKASMQEGAKSASSQMRSITTMVLTVAITFVVLETVTIVYVSFVVADYRRFGFRMIVSMFLLRSLSHLLTDINHAINFFLYVLSGRSFRRQFLAVVCYRCNNKATPTGTSTSETRVK